MKKIIHILILALIALTLLINCTPQKRLHRLVDQFPELKTTDTIKLVDTIITKNTRLDTFYVETFTRDTIVLTKEKLSMQLLRIEDTVFIDAVCMADTVIIEKEIPVEKVKYVADCTLDVIWDKYKWFVGIGLLLFLILLFILKWFLD